MNISRILTRAALAVVVILAAACTVSDSKAPPLQGPSTLGLSLTLAANPDVLSLDGASQSQITIEARDAQGQVAPNIPLRVEIVVAGTVVDYGSLSARTLVTGSNGRASLTYTAPPLVAAALPETVNIRVTPGGTDAATQIFRYVDIRLVLPGTIPAAGPTPSFTFSPASPIAFEDVILTSTSTAGVGAAITSTSWNFGDGATTSGTVVSHRFASGNYTVTLTVTDTNNVSTSTRQQIAVSAGNLPTALFTLSPSTGNVTNQTIFFNASSSTPGLGRRLVQYAWDFGTGSTGSGVIVSKSFDTVGSFNVTLTVTDDVGQFDTQTTAVAIAANSTSVATARFTFTPSPARVGQAVSFDGSPSSTSGGSIVRYEWSFGDGAIETTYAPIATTQHTYSTSGNKTASLTVYDSNGVASPAALHTVNVLP